MDATRNEIQNKQTECAAQLAAQIQDKDKEFANRMAAKQREQEAAAVAWQNEKQQLVAQLASQQQEWETRKKALLDDQASYQVQLRACQASGDPSAAKQIADREQNLMRSLQYMQRGNAWLLAHRGNTRVAVSRGTAARRLFHQFCKREGVVTGVRCRKTAASRCRRFPDSNRLTLGDPPVAEQCTRILPVMVVVDPRVYGADGGRVALCCSIPSFSTVDWDADEFLVADAATQVVTVVRGYPRQSPCAAWAASIDNQSNRIRFWCDCTAGAGDGVSTNQLSPKPSHLLAFHPGTQLVMLLANMDAWSAAPSGMMVDWDVEASSDPKCPAPQLLFQNMITNGFFDEPSFAVPILNAGPTGWRVQGQGGLAHSGAPDVGGVQAVTGHTSYAFMIGNETYLEQTIRRAPVGCKLLLELLAMNRGGSDYPLPVDAAVTASGSTVMPRTRLKPQPRGSGNWQRFRYAFEVPETNLVLRILVYTPDNNIMLVGGATVTGLLPGESAPTAAPPAKPGGCGVVQNLLLNEWFLGDAISSSPGIATTTIPSWFEEMPEGDRGRRMGSLQANNPSYGSIVHPDRGRRQFAFVQGNGAYVMQRVSNLVPGCTYFFVVEARGYGPANALYLSVLTDDDLVIIPHSPLTDTAPTVQHQHLRGPQTEPRHPHRSGKRCHQEPVYVDIRCTNAAGVVSFFCSPERTQVHGEYQAV